MVTQSLMNATQFNKGHIPHNIKPDGSKYIHSSQGYCMIKYKGNWIKNARYNWIKNYGEIPNGMIIHHKDENKLNDNIKNLAMGTRSSHVRHHNHNRPGGMLGKKHSEETKQKMREVHKRK